MMQTRRTFALTLAACAFSGLAAAQSDDISSPKLRISWEEFRKLHDARKVEIIDVRGADAFAEGHIPGARSVPLDQVEKRVESLRKLGKPLVTYCA